MCAGRVTGSCRHEGPCLDSCSEEVLHASALDGFGHLQHSQRSHLTQTMREAMPLRANRACNGTVHSIHSAVSGHRLTVDNPSSMATLNWLVVVGSCCCPSWRTGHASFLPASTSLSLPN